MHSTAPPLKSLGPSGLVQRAWRSRVQKSSVVLCSSRNSTRPAKSTNDLKRPAHIFARGSLSTDFKEYEGAGCLDKYMRLPVEQYSVLDPKLITMLGEDRFLLKVPRIDIMNLWIEPLATVKVTLSENPPTVQLRTETCEIFGSEMLQDLKLDGGFVMNFDANLRWKSSNTPKSKYEAGQGQITADARFDVWCEIKPPFNLMPKDMLEAACNVPMDGLMRALLPIFLSNLRNDYRKWATSEEYRLDRTRASWTALPTQSS